MSAARQAEEAAAAVDGFALLPAFAPDDASTGWNDLARSQGVIAFAEQWQTGVAVAERRFEAKVIAAAREEAQKAAPTVAALEHDQCFSASRS